MLCLLNFMSLKLLNNKIILIVKKVLCYIPLYIYIYIYIYICIYRVSQEECTKPRESVPYVKLYRYNPEHLYSKLNGYGDNGQRILKI